MKKIRFISPLRILGLFIRMIFACEIPLKFFFKVKYPHPVGVVIGNKAKIGGNVIIYQNVTIGSKKKEIKGDFPIIGDNTIIYANSLILGKIRVGNNSIIGAGSVVINNIPDNEVWAGVPAKKIKNVS